LGPSGQVVESFAVPATPQLAAPAVCFGAYPPGGKLPVGVTGSAPASSGSATASTTAP
jgi:hypothetical protein